MTKDIWEARALHYGHLTFPKTALTPGLDADLMLDYAYMGFLLQNGKRNVLIDTGISEKFIVNGIAWGGFKAVGGKSYVQKALAGIGVDPAQIDTVIYTHLHNDHSGNCDLFKNARFFTQKDEWNTMVDPLPIMKVRRDYDPALPQELSQVNLIKVNGDVELADGIKLIKTPGHSPGCQSVLVNHKRGIIAFIGDLCPLSCLAFPRQTELIDMHGKKHKITPAPEAYGSMFPISVVSNIYELYDSMAKVRAMVTADTPEYIIGGHEASFLFTGI
jgi:N-acyl homoserine lactone hydrolase